MPYGSHVRPGKPMTYEREPCLFRTRSMSYERDPCKNHKQSEMATRSIDCKKCRVKDDMHTTCICLYTTARVWRHAGWCINQNKGYVQTNLAWFDQWNWKIIIQTQWLYNILYLYIQIVLHNQLGEYESGISTCRKICSITMSESIARVTSHTLSLYVDVVRCKHAILQAVQKCKPVLNVRIYYFIKL